MSTAVWRVGSHELIDGNMAERLGSEALSALYNRNKVPNFGLTVYVVSTVFLCLLNPAPTGYEPNIYRNLQERPDINRERCFILT